MFWRLRLINQGGFETPEFLPAQRALKSVDQQQQQQQQNDFFGVFIAGPGTRQRFFLSVYRRAGNPTEIFGECLPPGGEPYSYFFRVFTVGRGTRQRFFGGFIAGRGT